MRENFCHAFIIMIISLVVSCVDDHVCEYFTETFKVERKFLPCFTPGVPNLLICPHGMHFVN